METRKRILVLLLNIFTLACAIQAIKVPVQTYRLCSETNAAMVLGEPQFEGVERIDKNRFIMEFTPITEPGSAAESAAVNPNWIQSLVSECKSVADKTKPNGIVVKIANIWQSLDPDTLDIQISKNVGGVELVSVSYVKRYTTGREVTSAVPPTADYSGTIPCYVNRPGVLKITGRNFHYFMLMLNLVDKCFSYQISWNREYPSAQRTFGKGALSSVLQTGINIPSSLASPKSITEGKKFEEKSVQLERKASAFFDLLTQYKNTRVFRKDKEKKTAKITIYTFVVMLDKSFRFAKSGTGIDDQLSKHVLLSGTATEVYYAGEFWIKEDGNGGKILCMDNSSGNYLPPQADLFRMKYLMEANFEGIQVNTYEHGTTEWKNERGIDV